jgi:hypothetical protein
MPSSKARKRLSTWILLARHRLNAAQRAVDRKMNETTVIGPVIDGMDLTGCA